jgi:hypothetical protein
MERAATWSIIQCDPIALGMNILPSECISLRSLLFHSSNSSCTSPGAPPVSDHNMLDNGCNTKSQDASPSPVAKEDRSGAEDSCNEERQVSSFQPMGYAVQYHLESDDDSDRAVCVRPGTREDVPPTKRQAKGLMRQCHCHKTVWQSRLRRGPAHQRRGLQRRMSDQHAIHRKSGAKRSCGDQAVGMISRARSLGIADAQKLQESKL